MYIGYFKDINNHDYSVKIIPSGTEGTENEITLSDNPVTITQKSDGLFDELKLTGCTVEILSKEIYPDMYSSGVKDVKVEVYSATSNVFTGYLTPYIYNQAYAHVYDTIQLEAVSKLSVIKEIDYTTVGDKPDIVSFKDIIWHILADGAGYDTIRVEYILGVDKRLSDFYISEANFFDNDEAHTPWTMEEVLVHICRYLGVTCFENGDTVYLVDYQKIANSPYHLNYFSSDYPDDKITTVGSTSGDFTKTFTMKDFSSDDSNLSYDDIYNKIEVSANGYNIDDLCPGIEDLENSLNITGYPMSAQWTRTEYKWNGKIKDQYTTYYEYQTLRTLKPESGWKHRFFRQDNGSEINSYYTSISPKSDFNANLSPQINTRCAMIQRYAYYAADDPKPTSLDWNTYITFFCIDDTTKPDNLLVPDSIDLLEQPVLEFTSPEPLRYSPNTGTSWITIKGDLFYQCNTQQKGAVNLNIVNNSDKYYTFSPVENVTQTSPYKYKVSSTYTSGGWFNWSETTYTRTMNTRKPGDSGYGTGWPLLKCKLQIGDKYWNGSAWTTTDSTFYINYNNSPSGGAEETINVLEWTSIAPNFDFTKNIDKDKCWAIPITKEDDLCGNLKFTLYTPSQMGPVLNEWSHKMKWTMMFPVIFMKDFELSYIYTDDTRWWLKDDKTENDVVYTNTVDTDYTRTYDKDIECKINSYTDNVPISRSFVLTSSKDFVTSLTNTVTNNNQQMEYQLIEKMLDHYSQKKLIYEATVEYYSTKSNIRFFPYIKHYFNFDNVDTFKNSDGSLKTFVIDSYTFEPKYNNIKVKFIEW